MRPQDDPEQLDALIRQQQLLIQMIESQTAGLRALITTLVTEQSRCVPGPAPRRPSVASPARQLAAAR